MKRVCGSDRGPPIKGGPRPSWKLTGTVVGRLIIEARIPEKVALRGDYTVETGFVNASTDFH